MRNVFILLPAYNEEQSIRLLVEKFSSAFQNTPVKLRFIVCDDGSTDKSGEILKEISQHYDVEVITHKINRGLGETVRDLFERANELASENDIFIRMDCDKTHDPSYSLAMIDKIDQGFDVVIASRFLPGGGQEGLDAYRTFISATANLMMKVLFPIRGIREYTCGYRAYRASFVRRAIEAYGNNLVQLKGLGFSCTLEKLVKFRLMGARFAEVPFVLRYQLKESSSKMIGSVTMFGYLAIVLFYYWPWGGWRSENRRKT